MIRRLCLYCDRPLNTRRWYGRRKKHVVRCSCGTAYSPETVLHSDPRTWERVRINRAYDAQRAEDGQINLYIFAGLGLHPKREKLKNAN